MRPVLVLFALLLIVLPQAEGQVSSSATKVGIGIGIEPVRLLPAGSTFFSMATTPVTIMIPIEFGGGMRLEPELGIFRYSYKLDASTTSSGTERTANFYRFGAGLSFPVAKVEGSSLYLGPKFGLFLTGSKTVSTGTSEVSETDFFIAFNIGGEHAVTDAFRVFAEAQFNYLSFGNPSYTPASPTTSERSQSIIFTNAAIGMRFLF